jgi:glycosyltransferase involved in cell wall biosynthesis
MAFDSVSFVTDPAVVPVSGTATTLAAADPRTPEIDLDFSNDEQAFVLSRARRLLALGRIDTASLFAPAEPPATDATAIIPARNEAATIAAIVQAVRAYVSEVIVVEGGSQDATAQRAAAAGARVIRDPGLGKGAAMRLAVEQVRTPFCLFVDADGSHDPIDIPRLLAPLRAGEADHVGGSRLLGGSDELHGGGDEFLRLAGSAFITCLVNLRYGVRLSDSQNGFRALRTDLFRRLALRSRHTTIEMEMVMTTLAAGGRILEVPTRERRRAAGYSKISLARPGVWLAYGWTLLRGICRRRSPLPSAGPAI